MTKKQDQTPVEPNLFDELSKRKQPSRLVDLPVKDENGESIGKIIIRTLVHDDNVEIQKAATLECDRIYKDEKIDHNSDIYQKRFDNIAAKHFIFRACRDPENPEKPFFPTPEHVGKHLSNDEIMLLLRHYETLQSERGPVIAYMSDNQFEEWVGKLAKAAEDSPYFLDLFLPEAKDHFIMYMARQLLSLQTAKFSATLPAEDSGKNTPPQQ